MYLNQLIWVLFTSVMVSASAQCNELIISKYIEGSSNNKGIEITNTSTKQVQISNYRIAEFGNGSLSSTRSFSFPDTLLQSGISVTVARQFEGSIFEKSDFQFGFNFNGDDAIALINTQLNDTIDIIGVIGEQPNKGWDVNGETQATADKTLVRKNHINQGEKDWEISQLTWNVYPTDFLAGFGEGHSLSVPFCDPITFLHEKEKSIFTISPNPAKPSEKIQIHSNNALQEITITNINGITLLSQNPENNFIYLPHNLYSGIYFIQILSKEGFTSIEKLVVE